MKLEKKVTVRCTYCNALYKKKDIREREECPHCEIGKDADTVSFLGWNISFNTLSVERIEEFDSRKWFPGKSLDRDLYLEAESICLEWVKSLNIGRILFLKTGNVLSEQIFTYPPWADSGDWGTRTYLSGPRQIFEKVCAELGLAHTWEEGWIEVVVDLPWLPEEILAKWKNELISRYGGRSLEFKSAINQKGKKWKEVLYEKSFALL